MSRNRISSATRAVVTGAGSGLGRAFVLELVRRGAAVVACDLDEPSARETADLAAATEASARVIPSYCDVTDSEQLEAAAALCDRELGGVDLVVNNAGVAVSGRVEDVSLEDWRHVVDVNLWGVVYGCRAFVPRLRAQGRGGVINVASVAGLVSGPELGPYNVTKSGVVALSETMFVELRGEGIDVTVLCPTFFRTGILDAARGTNNDEDRDLARRAMERSRVQAPEVAACALDALERGRLYALPMRDGRVVWRLKRWMPERFARSIPRMQAFFRRAAERGSP